jgi:hypothetical protein
MNPQKPPAIGTLIAGIGVALVRPRVWLLLLGLSLLFGLAVATPVHQSALEQLAPTSIFGDDPLRGGNSMPRWVLDDWTRLHQSAFAAASAALAPLLLLSSLLGVLISAGWIHAAIRGREDHGLKQFLSGAGQHFFPMLRLWVVGLAFYWLTTWLVWGPAGDWVMSQFFPAGDVDRATSESRALWGQNIRIVFYALGLLKIEMIMDLARAAVVSSDSRSAVTSFLRAIRFWIWRWPSCFLLVFAGLILEAGWIALIVRLSQILDLPLWTLALSVPVGRILLRGGRTSGLALLYHASTLPGPKPGGTGVHPPKGNKGPLDEGSAWGTPA